jgi:lipopolysaccharide heptosyltransferase II
MEYSSIKKILLISITGIGNTVLFTPVIRNVRNIFPYSSIYFLGSSQTMPVVEGSPYIDYIILYDKNNNKYWAQIKLIKFIWQKKFDLVINAFSERSTIKFALLTYISRAKIRAGVNMKKVGSLYTHKISPVFDRHELDQNLDILRTFVSQELSRNAFFHLNDPDKKYAKDFLSKYNSDNSSIIISIHPGSAPASLQKRWSMENYASLGKWLVKKYTAQILIHGSKDEINIANKIENQIPNSINCAGKTTLKQTAALIDMSDLFIGHDSGLMHIAAALNKPVIALFGPTSDQMYRPYCKQNLVIKSEDSSMESIKLSNVIKSVRQVMDEWNIF